MNPKSPNLEKEQNRENISICKKSKFSSPRPTPCHYKMPDSPAVKAFGKAGFSCCCYPVPLGQFFEHSDNARSQCIETFDAQFFFLAGVEE